MEWDTAAGDAVLRAAGGLVFDAAGRPLRYGKTEAEFRNGPFVAWVTPRRPFFEHSYFEHSYMDMAIWHSFALKKP